MCVAGTKSRVGYTQVAGTLQNTFPADFLPKPQFCDLQSGYNDNNNTMKPHHMKGLGYNKHTTLGENTIRLESPLTIAYRL